MPDIAPSLPRTARAPWRWLWSVALAGAAFVWGLLAGAYQVFPYEPLRLVKNSVDGVKGTPPNRAYQSNPKVAEIAAGMEIWGSAAPVVMVGDSLTAQGQWGEMFPDIAILNRGIGGDTAGGVADRAALILKTRPQRIFLMIGLNDLFYPGNSDDQIIAQFDRAMAGLRQSGAALFVQSIIICNAANPSCSPARQARLRRFNAALERLSVQHGARFVELNTRLGGPDGLRGEFTWDGMHLNGQGYAAWREILRPHIGGSGRVAQRNRRQSGSNRSPAQLARFQAP